MKDGRCVFLNGEGRCVLQKASLARPGLHLKPFFCTAFPVTIAHGVLMKKVESLAADMELLISGLLTKCYNQKGRRGSLEFPSEVQA